MQAVGDSMKQEIPIPRRLKLERLGAAFLVGILLFAVSYLADWALYWLKIPGISTIADNLVIGACAAVAAYIWARFEAERQDRARAKMFLVIELNHHIRNAVTLLGQSAVLEDGPQKLRLIDEAVDRIDRVLTELVPTAGETHAPRLFLDERPQGLSPSAKRKDV
jgi:hypothetical protein